MILYGGFSDGKLHWQEIDDGWGGTNWRKTPALFKTRQEARVQYRDVRKIEIKEASADKGRRR